MKTIEYRVRPVTRYIVTRFHSDCTISEVHGSLVATTGGFGSEVCGEFDREDMAERVARALANAEPDGTVSVNGYPLERCLTSVEGSPAE